MSTTVSAVRKRTATHHFARPFVPNSGFPFTSCGSMDGHLMSSGREGTWRRLRYRALLGLKQAHDFNAIATGHHRDDVAEGVLVQLLRGGGPRALSGIEASTSDGIIRPLLPWSREEIRFVARRTMFRVAAGQLELRPRSPAQPGTDWT